MEFRLLYQSLSFVIFSFTRQHLLCAMKEKQIITMFLPHSFLNIKNKPCPMCELEQDFAEISVSEYTYLYIHYILIFALCYMVFFTKNRIVFFVDHYIQLYLFSFSFLKSSIKRFALSSSHNFRYNSTSSLLVISNMRVYFIFNKSD